MAQYAGKPGLAGFNLYACERQSCPQQGVRLKVHFAAVKQADNHTPDYTVITPMPRADKRTAALAFKGQQTIEQRNVEIAKLGLAQQLPNKTFVLTGALNNRFQLLLTHIVLNSRVLLNARAGRLEQEDYSWSKGFAGAIRSSRQIIARTKPKTQQGELKELPKLGNMFYPLPEERPQKPTDDPDPTSDLAGGSGQFTTLHHPETTRRRLRFQSHFPPLAEASLSTEHSGEGTMRRPARSAIGTPNRTFKAPKVTSRTQSQTVRTRNGRVPSERRNMPRLRRSTRSQSHTTGTAGVARTSDSWFCRRQRYDSSQAAASGSRKPAVGETDHEPSTKEGELRVGDELRMTGVLVVLMSKLVNEGMTREGALHNHLTLCRSGDD